MIREFRLPDVGEGVAEGEIVEWLVEPGDPVSEDQPVAEVETDKALVEIPSPYDGTVHELHADPGEVVPVGEVVISFDVPEEAADEGGAAAEAAGGGSAAEQAAAEEPTAEQAAAEEPTAEQAAAEQAAAEQAPEPVDGEQAPEPIDGEGTEAAAAGGEAEPTAETGEAEPPTRPGGAVAPPSVRRLARELGVDLDVVAGSGPGGRVTESDVRTAAEGGTAAGTEGEAAATAEETSEGKGEEPPEPRSVGEGLESAVTRRDGASGAEEGETEGERTTAAGPSGAEAAGRERTLAAPATRRIAEEAGVDIDDVPTDETRDGEAFVTPEQVRAYAAGGATEPAETGEGTGAEGESGAEAEAEPRPSGERVPYRGVRRTIGDRLTKSKFTAPHVTHHDSADVTELVAVREELNAAADVRLTYLPLVMKAVIAGLREFPYVNAQLDEERSEIVLRDEYNLGVATATDAGLMVPVIEDADAKGLEALASEVAERTDRARDRTIDREELQGGTFTITNVGTIGGEYATPIVNYPEVAILALGAIEDRPRVVDGEVVARKTLPLSLSIDHRVVDGAVAARFTNHVIDLLEHPTRLLLDLE
ncbi:MAG: dihydrolipoamide acetyltransferase family protein [Haloferacaceae archaeon]